MYSCNILRKVFSREGHALCTNIALDRMSHKCLRVLVADGTNTRCSAIAERPRCRVRYSFGQKWKTRTERIFYGHYRSTFNRCDIAYRPENLSNSVKKTQNKGYYGVQGHSRSSRSVPIESLYAISY